MTKITKLVDTIINTAVAAVTPKPYSVNVFGPVTTAMQRAAVLIRAGYIPCIDSPIKIFAEAGTISMTLVVGSPDQAFVEAAAADTADAVAREQAQYARDVELAASRQIEAAKLADKEARRAAMIAQHAAALAKLTSEFDAA